MYFPPTKANPRRLFVLCVSLLATSAIYLYLHTSFRATGDLPVLGVPSDQQHGRCDLPRQIDDVFVVLKTGANDALGAVPAHVATTLRCIPHYIIYSDMEEDIDGHHLYDVLAEVDPVIQETNPEFEYYRRLREKGREAFSAEESARWSSAQNTVGGKDSPGWKLDKWKFLPMAEQALRARPNAKWYVIIESDSYVLWGNLLRWLSGFDASKPYYLGMQMQVDDIIFAYGGSGIILSRPALEKVVRHRQDNLKSYDEFTAAHWAGDCVLGKALSDAGVDLFFSWPNVFTESPVEMNFNYSIGDLRPWCHHVASYHHLKPADILEFSEFEKSHPPNFLQRHRDTFLHYILPRLQPERPDWDNLCEDDDEAGNGSASDCRNACRAQADCVQYLFSDKGCKTSSIVRLGHAHAASNTDKRTSGWLLDRVESFAEKMQASCRPEPWILP